MALLSELIDIPLSIQRDDFVLKLDEGIRDDTATKTLSDYVITPELAPKFDEALRFLEAAVTTGTSKATFLHGSFGAGKSHFMAILHLILQGAPAARGHAKLTHIMPKHAGWLANRKFLLIPYHMIGKRDVTSAILGTYVEHVRKHHPQAAIPGVYLGETLFEDARQLHRKFGDAAFFENLNQQGGDDGWGKSTYERRWDAASFAEATQAAPGSDPRSQLISALQRTYFSSYATQAESNTEAFLPLDKGLQVVARHAKSLGYDAVVLFLDELVLWLAGRAADPEFVHQEVQKLVNRVESQDSRREIPIISFVARQRDVLPVS